MEGQMQIYRVSFDNLGCDSFPDIKESAYAHAHLEDSEDQWHLFFSMNRKDAATRDHVFVVPSFPEDRDSFCGFCFCKWYKTKADVPKSADLCVKVFLPKEER
jgi:hypothetical protein